MQAAAVELLSPPPPLVWWCLLLLLLLRFSGGALRLFFFGECWCFLWVVLSLVNLALHHQVKYLEIIDAEF